MQTFMGDGTFQHDETEEGRRNLRSLLLPDLIEESIFDKRYLQDSEEEETEGVPYYDLKSDLQDTKST